MTIKIYDDDDNEVVLQTHKEVCPNCHGEGKHVNRAIDGNGITADEWWNEWDDESREMYLTGGYDVVCEECGGKNVIDVVDENDPHYELYLEYMKAEWELRAMEEAERRAGC